MSSQWSPQAQSVLSRLVECTSLEPPKIVALTEIPEPTAQEPHPGLKALTQIVAPNTSATFDFDNSLQTLAVPEQL